MTSYHRDPGQAPAVQVAYQQALAASIKAEAAFEAAAAAAPDGLVWDCTPAADHCQELEYQADLAWERFSAAWTAVACPESTAQAQAELRELDRELGPDPIAEIDNGSGLGM